MKYCSAYTLHSRQMESRSSIATDQWTTHSNTVLYHLSVAIPADYASFLCATTSPASSLDLILELEGKALRPDPSFGHILGRLLIVPSGGGSTRPAIRRKQSLRAKPPQAIFPSFGLAYIIVPWSSSRLFFVVISVA